MCHSTDKYGFTEPHTTNRTVDSIHNNPDEHWEADNDWVSLKQNQRKLDYSKGVKQRPADPYPAASRIVPPLLHMDMGICTALLHIHAQYVKNLKAHATQQRLQSVFKKVRITWFNLKNLYTQLTKHQDSELKSQYAKLYEKCKEFKQRKAGLQQIIDDKEWPNYVEMQLEELKKHQVLKSLFFENLEGNQARDYRQNIMDIAKFMDGTKFLSHLAKIIKYLNGFMEIAGRATHYISEEEIDQAKEALLDLDKQWKYTSQVPSIIIYIIALIIWIFGICLLVAYQNNLWNLFKNCTVRDAKIKEGH